MLLKGVLGYLPVQIVQAVAGFGAIVVFTRLLSPADYGAYALAFSLAGLIQTACLTWIEAAMARFYVAESERGDKAALYGSLYRAFFAVSAALVLIAAVALTLAPISTGLKLAIGSSLAAVIARSLLKVAQERRRAAGEVRGFAVYDVIQTGGGFLLGVVFALIGWGAAAPIAGFGAASAVLLFWALPGEWKEAKAGALETAKLKGYAAYGLPLAASLLMSLALASTDRFVLAAYMNTAAVGAYHAGYSLSNRSLDIIFLWLGMASSPATVAALERGGEAALRRTAGHQAALMLLITVPAAVGLALVSAPLCQLMVGPALAADAARVTPWIAASALFAGLSTHYLHTAFTLSKKPRNQLIAIAVPALANLALTLILIPRFGLMGAVWATTASYALGMLVSYGLMRRSLVLPVPWGTLARVAAASALMAAVILRLPALGGLPELLLKASVGGLVYTLAALALDAGGARSEGVKLLRGLKGAPA